MLEEEQELEAALVDERALVEHRAIAVGPGLVGKPGEPEVVGESVPRHQRVLPRVSTRSLRASTRTLTTRGGGGRVRTMNAEHNAASARRFFEATTSGDESAVELLHEDVTWELPPGLTAALADRVPGVRVPDGEVWCGRESTLTELLGPVVAAFEVGSLQTRIDDLIADDDRVVVLLHVEATHVSGGRYENDYVLHMTFREGRIAAVREYMDTARFLDVFPAIAA
jgi:uncharacterized protein